LPLIDIVIPPICTAQNWGFLLANFWGFLLAGDSGAWFGAFFAPGLTCVFGFMAQAILGIDKSLLVIFSQ